MKNQFEVFASVLNQFTDAEKALGYAIDSENSAWNENEKYLDSIEAKQQQIKQQLSELVLGEGGLQDLLKKLLDVGIALLKFANSDIGTFLIKVALAVGALNGFVEALKYLKLVEAEATLQTIAKSALACAGSFDVATIATNLFNGALTLLEKHPVLIALTVAIGLIEFLANATDRATKKAEELSTALDEAKNTYDQANNSIKQLEEELAKIQEQKADPSLSSEELENLEKEEEELNKKLILQQKIADEAEREMKAKAEEARGTKTPSVGYTGRLTGETNTLSGTVEENVEKQIEDVQHLNEKLEENRQAMLSLAKTKEEYNALSESDKKAYDSYNETYNKYNDILSEVEGSLAKNIQTIEQWKSAGIDTDGVLETLTNKYYDLEKALGNVKYTSADDVYKELGKSAEEVAKYFEEDEEAYERFLEALNNGNFGEAVNIAMGQMAEGADGVSQTLEEATEAYENAVSAISGMESAFTDLNDVIASYNQNGYLSLEMLEKLLSMDSEYLSLLDWENGQMSLNEESALALADAEISIAEAKLITKAQAEAEAIANGEVNDTWIAGEEASKIASIAAETAGMSAEEAGEKAQESARKWDEFWSSVAGDMSKYDTQAKKDQLARLEKETKNSLAGMENYRKTLRSTTGGIKSYTSATKGATSATKSQKSAVDELTQSLEAQIKEYEKVIKYINKKFDQEIDRIKDLKDAELDSIDARIDALEELRDAQLDAIQDQIDALEKENDALSDQLELQELLNNLAKAKSSKVKIYRGGQFVYDQDFEQVSEAQKALNEYNSKKRLQDQIDALNDYKDQVKKNYDQQIKDLENYRKAREQAWDAQIKYWQDYKQKFNDMVNSYENEQNRLKALELTGIDFEAQGWQTRLGNLQNFVNNYISLLNQLTEAKKKAQAEEYASSVTTPSNGDSSAKIPTKTTATKTKASVPKKNIAGVHVSGSGLQKNIARAYASGSNYIKADELAVVGEDPHKEIVIGSDLNTNSGVMMNLHKGSGVVPATATSALMSLADNIRANGVNATANNILGGNDITNMEIANVNVNANNADEFVQSMREFRISMLQKAYK